MGWLLDPDGKPGTADAPQIVLNAWGLGDRAGSAIPSSSATCNGCARPAAHVVFAAGNGGPMPTRASVPPTMPRWRSARSTAAASWRCSAAVQLRLRRAALHPDLLAPGELLQTTDRSAGALAVTTRGTGTSFAAAVVAGELALLAQAHPGMPLAQRRRCCAGAEGDARPPLARALGLSVRSQP